MEAAITTPLITGQIYYAGDPVTRIALSETSGLSNNRLSVSCVALSEKYTTETGCHIYRALINNDMNALTQILSWTHTH